MNCITLKTRQQNITQAIAELKQQSAGCSAGLVLYFASSTFEPQQLAHEMQQLFADSSVVGCTTAGEIANGEMFEGGIVVMCFGADLISDFKVELLCDITTNDQAVNNAFASFGEYFHSPMSHLDPLQYFGIVLIDGMSKMEERINERIGDLSNVSFIGASAGDDLNFNKTYIFANGKAYSNAAVLILVKPAVNFEFIKTQSFCSTGKTVIATKVDEDERIIHQLNNQPATQTYAQVLNASESELGDLLFFNPIGLKISDTDFFVRSPQKIDKQSIRFFCAVKEGMELDVLNATDIVSDMRELIAVEKSKAGGIAALINFHCILRTLALKQTNQKEEYAALFADFPTIGFSTYGESYIGHMNQTSTILILRNN